MQSPLKHAVSRGPSSVPLTPGCSLDTMTRKLLARVETAFRILHSAALSWQLLKTVFK